MLSIEYSILCHYPSIMSKDRITLGIIFLNKADRIACFHSTKNFKRVGSFNDELDIDLLKIQLESIEDEVGDIVVDDNFKLRDYTRFYVNEIRFEAIQTVEIQDDFQQFIDETLKIHMRFDFDKKERPTKNDQIKYFKKYFKQNISHYSNKGIRGEFDEIVTFDFTVNHYVFKLFVFNGKQEKKIMNSIKAFAYNANHLKDNYKVVAVIEDDSDNNFEVVKKILTANCFEVIPSSKLIEYVTEIESEFVHRLC